ncbi:MAG: hypothetical protein AB4042_19545 [Leptolyngbyaceae cyanobacterium]
MTHKVSDLLSLAQQGQEPAIATLLNQSLQKHNLSATVVRQGLILRILVTGPTVPAQSIALYLQQTLLQIDPAFTNTAVIGGQQTGDRRPQWTETVSLTDPGILSIPAEPTAVNPEAETPAFASQQVTLEPLTAQPATLPSVQENPPAQSNLTPHILKLLAWELGTLFCAFAPIMVYLFSIQEISRIAELSPDLMADMASAYDQGMVLLGVVPLALLVFILGVRPLALQEGTVLATGVRWRLPYISAFGIHLAVLIVMLMADATVGQSLFSRIPIARVLLLGMMELGLYRAMLRFPPNSPRGWWPMVAAVLFMEGMTRLPLWLMSPLLNELTDPIRTFQLFW